MKRVQKILGDKSGSCVLCQNHGELRRSHIISDFLYDYGDDHKLFPMVSEANRIEEFKSEQQAIREFLLCDKCEIKRSRWETVVSSQLGKEFEDQSRGLFVIPGVSYREWKLLMLSNLFLAHHSRRQEFQVVDLSSQHQSTIREALTTEEPGSPIFFPVYAMRDIGEALSHLNFVSPDTYPVEGVTAYEFVFACHHWFILLTEDMASNSKLAEFFLGRHPDWFVLPVLSIANYRIKKFFSDKLDRE